MSTSIFQFKFSKFENRGGGCDDHKLSGMSKSTNKGRVQKKLAENSTGGGVSDGRFSTKKKQEQHGLKTLDFT